MRFIYKARNSAGVLVSGDVNADSREEAVKGILREGYVPLEVEQKDIKAQRAGEYFQKGRVRLEDLADFLRRFSDLLQADIPLVRALQIVEKRTARVILREAIGRVLINVQDGAPLSVALSAEPGIFPQFWSGLIYAGELSGRLKEILSRLSQIVEKDIETKSRLVSGAIYPFLILIVGMLTVFVLLTFVVPKLSGMFAELGQNLPLMTRALLLVSAVLVKTWWMFLLIIVFIVFWEYWF